jgi:hypothetical protein
MFIILAVEFKIQLANAYSKQNLKILTQIETRVVLAQSFIDLALQQKRIWGKAYGMAWRNSETSKLLYGLNLNGLVLNGHSGIQSNLRIYVIPKHRI